MVSRGVYFDPFLLDLETETTYRINNSVIEESPLLSFHLSKLHRFFYKNVVFPVGAEHSYFSAFFMACDISV